MNLHVITTDEHISDGVRDDCSACPVALAITEALETAEIEVFIVSANHETVDLLMFDDSEWSADLPDIAKREIDRFDNVGDMDDFSMDLTFREEVYE